MSEGEKEVMNVSVQALSELDPFERQLDEFCRRYENVVYNLDDSKQNKQARSDKHQIGKVISRLDKQHKLLKEPLLEATRLLDGKRKEIKDGLLDVQGQIKSQIDEHEAKEKARVDGHFERIQGIRAAMEWPDDVMAATLRDLLADVKAIAIDDSFEEFKADAALAKQEAVEHIEKQLAAREKHEAEQAEIERLRAEKEARERANREARIAAEAAEKAKHEAERAAQVERERIERAAQEEREAAERARIQIEEKAKKEVAEANDRAERAADEERRRIEKEKLQKERTRKEEQEKENKRKARQKHRSKIHSEAEKSLVAAGIESKTATEIINLIIADEVTHVQIVY